MKLSLPLGYRGAAEKPLAWAVPTPVKQDLQTMEEQDDMSEQENSANLVWLIGPQPAAEVCVAPSESFVPGWRDKNFILFYRKNAFVCTHDLSHRLFEFYKKQINMLEPVQGKLTSLSHRGG